MSRKTIEAGVVSWELFDALYENQADFCRKLRFLVKAGRVTKEEGLALDIVFDQLNSKENEIIKLRVEALSQKKDLDEPVKQNVKINSKYADATEEADILELREEVFSEKKDLDEPVEQNVKFIRTEENHSKYADATEEADILEKLKSIRQEDGSPWENIKSIIDGTYSSIRKKTEKQ